MTNLEKFEEIFGIKLDPYEAKNTSFPCECAHIDFCDRYECNLSDDSQNNCPAIKFWSKEYKEEKNGK